MRTLILLFCLSNTLALQAQTKAKAVLDSLSSTISDSLMREHLVRLALKNPSMVEADVMVTSAELELKRAKSTWLNSLSVSGNVNEFVINNSNINGVPASTLYPKYNIGINLPLGLFGRQEKNIAKEKIKLYQAQKDGRANTVRKEVLIRFESYKEVKDLYDLQKQITDGQFSTYQQMQRDYARGEINDIKEVNKQYEEVIDQRSNLRTKEKELRIAELELEEILGMRLADAFRSVVPKK